MNNFNSTVATLNNKYDINTPIDISPFFLKDGKSWLRKLVESQYKEVFDGEFRLVLYFNNDEHLYGSSPGRLITTLQQHISAVDISNFFVVIITADKKTKSDADVVNRLYSTSDVPMTVYVVDTVDCQYTPTVIPTETICVLPWYHLFIGTGGDVLPCCDSIHSLPLGSVNDDSIDTIVNSSKFNAVREKMISGKRPKECSSCYDIEDIGIESKRHKMNKIYKDKYDSVVNGNATKMNVKLMDINLGNTCNFKCRMCTGFSSSRLRAEEKKIDTHGTLAYKILPQNSLDKIMPELLDLVNEADSVYFAGGESLLIPEYNRVLERLIHLEKLDLDITYATNLSLLPKKAIRYWKKFNNMTVIVSIDSDKEHAEYYRHGTKWNSIIENYNTLFNDYPNIKLQIRSTLSIYNAFRLMPLQVKWIKDGLIEPHNMIINIIEHPDYQSVQVLPAKYKNKLTRLIDQHIEFLNCYNNSDILTQQWLTIRKFLTIDMSFKLKQFFEYTYKLDAHREEQFELLHPEYIGLRQHIGE